MRERTREPSGLDAVTGSFAKRRNSFLRGRVSPLRPEVIFQGARVPMSQISLPQKLPRLSGKFPLLLGLKSLPELPPGALIAAIHPEISRKAVHAPPTQSQVRSQRLLRQSRLRGRWVEVCRSEPTSAKQPRHAFMSFGLCSIKGDFRRSSVGGPNTSRRDLHPDPALRDADYVLTNGPASPGFSNQSGSCHARSATLKPKAKPQRLLRRRDIGCALIEVHLVDCMVASLPFPV